MSAQNIERAADTLLLRPPFHEKSAEKDTDIGEEQHREDDKNMSTHKTIRRKQG
jgi:hypothetical protein